MTLIVDFPERRAQFDDFTWGEKAALEKVNVAFREGPEPYEADARIALIPNRRPSEDMDTQFPEEKRRHQAPLYIWSVTSF
jgi:hypothetical protein